MMTTRISPRTSHHRWTSNTTMNEQMKNLYHKNSFPVQENYSFHLHFQVLSVCLSLCLCLFLSWRFSFFFFACLVVALSLSLLLFTYKYKYIYINWEAKFAICTQQIFPISMMMIVDNNKRCLHVRQVLFVYIEERLIEVCLSTLTARDNLTFVFPSHWPLSNG